MKTLLGLAILGIALALSNVEETMSDQPHPYVGMWVTADGYEGDQRRADTPFRPAWRHRTRAARAVAWQVGDNQGVAPRQYGSHLTPGDVRLGKAVKQQERRSCAANDAGEANATSLDIQRAEAGKERRLPILRANLNIRQGRCGN